MASIKVLCILSFLRNISSSYWQWLIKGCLSTLVLQSANWQLYSKAWHFWGYTYSERFDIRALFVLSTVTSKIQNRPKNGIKSWIFSCDYFIQLLTWINSTTVHRWTLFNFWPWSSINDKCFSMLWLIQLRSYFTSKQIS